MDILGWFLAFAGSCGLVFGVLQMLKMKKMNRVPHRRPSEIQQLGPRAADARGLLSTEGSAQPGPSQIFGPMSGEPCLAYEIVIEAKWEKHEDTEDGTKKTSGSKNVHSENRGCQFYVTDGVGSVLVDSTGALDAAMEKSHSSEVGVSGIYWPSTLRFGHMDANTPIVPSDDSRVIGFVGTERIVRPSATIYALGQLDVSPHGPTLHTPKGIGTGKLILSPKGRAKLLGATKRNMILGFALGGVLSVGGTGAGLFAPKTEALADAGACPDAIADEPVNCDDRISSRVGKTYSWTVRQGGYFDVKVKVPPKKDPISPVVALKSADGRSIAQELSFGAEDAWIAHQKLEPGSYTVTVTDAFGRTPKGGLGFHLSVERDTSMKNDDEKDAAPDETLAAEAEPPSPVEEKPTPPTPARAHSAHGSKPKPKAHASADAGSAAAPPKSIAPAPPAPPAPPAAQAKAEVVHAPPPPAAPPPKPAPPPEKKGLSFEVHFP